ANRRIPVASLPCQVERPAVVCERACCKPFGVLQLAGLVHRLDAREGEGDLVEIVREESERDRFVVAPADANRPRIAELEVDASGHRLGNADAYVEDVANERWVRVGARNEGAYLLCALDVASVEDFLGAELVDRVAA